ncbi:hypothetical protein ERJ75_000690400 [Trypanosoma vivax]|nr:hypothetical protein ERJ75_000690400 [Trypanosoma vivax]
MLRGTKATNGGFDEVGNDGGLILPMILLCNDGRSGNTGCGTSEGNTCPCSPQAVDNGSLENTEAKGWVWKVLKATEVTDMDSAKHLIIGNWLITKHICENRTTHVRSLGTAADLAAQLEHCAHGIVHAMKPSGKADGYKGQKMCLGQVVSNQACDGGKSSGAYACACFDKAAEANRGKGIKFINHLLAAANALRRLQRLRDEVTRHRATINAIEERRLSAKEKRADTGNTGKINTSARAGKGNKNSSLTWQQAKGPPRQQKAHASRWEANGTRTGRRAAQKEKRRTPPVKQGETPQKRTSQASWEQ